MTKLFASAGIGMLALALGLPAMMRAQDEPKPPRQEEPKTETQGEREAKPKQQDEAKPREGEAKPPRQGEKEEKRQPAESRQQEHAGQEHAARPAGKSVHIPDDKFRAQFGRQHKVVIRQPVIVEGQPRFQYSGYWFVIADPWPAEWAYTDDCYIDYVDGEYFLFDLLHPGVRIALFVVM
jgi:hypothetical protein